MIKKILKGCWLLPGFLLWASFPPMAERADALFALAPLLWLVRRGEAKTSAKRWFLNGLLFWFATLSWFPAIVKNGGPWPLVVLGWAGLSAYCAGFFAAFGACAARYWRWAEGRAYGWRLAGLVVVEPVLWAGFELLRSRLFGGFAWNQLGVSAVNAGFGAPAALGGVYLVSALVVLVNGTVASIAERMLAPISGRAGRIPRWCRSVETLLPLLLVYACFRGTPAREVTGGTGTQRFSVALVQRNFPCCFQGPSENPLRAYSNLLARVALLKPDLVVLPESALCEFGRADGPRAARFAEFVRAVTGARQLLAGGNREEAGSAYNSAALYSFGESDGEPAGANIQFYDKVHLVPFGEYIPGDKLFPALQKLAPVGSCTPGKAKLLGDYGVAICFEDTDSALMRRYAAMGAKALVFITNDSWFSRSNESVQHAWQATARAIETGLPVLRVGNSGVTCTVLPDGRATVLFGADGRPLVDAAGTLFDRIPLASPRVLTPYTRFGDLPLGIVFALLILALIMVEYKEHHEKRRIVSLQIG